MLLADADYSFLLLRWQSIIIGDDNYVWVLWACPAQVQFKSKVSMLGSNHGYALCLNVIYESFYLSLQKSTIYLIPANKVFEVSHHCRQSSRSTPQLVVYPLGRPIEA